MAQTGESGIPTRDFDLIAIKLALFSLPEIIIGPRLVWVGIGKIPTRTTLFSGVIIIVTIVIMAVLGDTQRKKIHRAGSPFL